MDTSRIASDLSGSNTPHSIYIDVDTVAADVNTTPLQSALSLLSAILESTADGILVVDLEGTVLCLNPRFVEMWSIPDQVLSSRDARTLMFVLDQFQDSDEFMTKVRELYAQPLADSFDVLKLKDGRIFERYSQPQRIGETVVARVWSFRDVTDRKRAEAG